METFQKALNSAMGSLSKKQFSKKEISQKLKKKEFEPEIIEKVLEKLEEFGFLDDNFYAENIIEYYKNKKQGPLKISEELYKRGIPTEVIKDKLCEFKTDLDIICELYEQKLKGDISEYKNIEKTKAYLYRKGFKFDDINRAFSLYKESLEDN